MMAKRYTGESNDLIDAWNDFHNGLYKEFKHQMEMEEMEERIYQRIMKDI